MKLICVSIIILILCSVTFQLMALDKNISEIEKLENLYDHNTKKKQTKKLPPKKNVQIFKLYGNVYWKGWIKYFKYNFDTTVKKPDTFYQNPYFNKQKTLVSQMHQKDLEGRPQFIPTLHHFWAKLLSTGNLNILSNRINESNTLADTIANLNTDIIKYIHKDDNASGAIKDLGSLKEGHCLSVSTLKPEPKKERLYDPQEAFGEDQTWVICLDDEKQKKILMSYLVSIKLQRQKHIGSELEEINGNKGPKTGAELLKPKPVMPKIRRGGPSHDDGYMILLQDWSECSVKCGGGFSTQQWMCVPPRKKGLPCPGASIMTKPCNKKPCPSVNGVSLGLPKNDKTHVTLNPIYTALPFSSRPQNYVECEIKESDIFYVTKEFDVNKKLEVKVPARLVMNTQTISVFKDDSYETALVVFNLADTALSLSQNDHCCMYLTNENRETQVCAFGSNCGTRSDPKWVNQWLYDSAFFLSKCRKELESTDIKNIGKNPKTGKPVAPNSGQGNAGSIDMFDETQQQIIQGKRQIIKKQVSSKMELEMDKRVGKTEKIAMTALRREINLEDLITKEEIEKGKEKEEELSVQVKQEQKKKDVLKQALHTRAESFKEVRLAKKTQVKMDGIKNETKMDIKFKRSVLKKKIDTIRTKFKRKHRLLQQKITKIRSEMAGDIMKANKNGDQKLCKNGRKDPKLMNDYCDANEPTDYVKNQGCKESDSFCYKCCEIEFGDLFINNRDACITMCDEEESKDLKDGDWIWTVGGAKDS